MPYNLENRNHRRYSTLRPQNGLDSLLDLPGFGALGLAQLKFQLEKHKIIDKTGHSDLYQYISFAKRIISEDILCLK